MQHPDPDSVSFFLEISKNPVINGISFLIGFVGFVLAIIFYIKSKKLKKPIYWMKTFELLKGEEKFSKMSILYEGAKVNTVSLTKVVFFNAGNETIDSGDIAQNDPLRIEIGGGTKILDKDIIYVKNKANNFRLEETGQNNILNIQFDYLDKEEGGVFQITHTGASPDAINLKGSIKGVSHILKRKNNGKLFYDICFSAIIMMLAFFVTNTRFHWPLKFSIYAIIVSILWIMFSKFPSGSVTRKYDNKI
ncbi:MAG: hypothetical protein WC614_01030 [bacterium]